MAAGTSAAAVLLASTVVDFSTKDVADYVAHAAALVLFCGIIFLLAGVLRLGFIAQFLSRPVVDAFVFGLAIFVTVKQLPKLFGIESGEGDTIRQLAHVIGAPRRVERRHARDRHRIARDPLRRRTVLPARSGRPRRPRARDRRQLGAPPVRARSRHRRDRPGRAPLDRAPARAARRHLDARHRRSGDDARHLQRVARRSRELRVQVRLRDRPEPGAGRSRIRQRRIRPRGRDRRRWEPLAVGGQRGCRGALRDLTARRHGARAHHGPVPHASVQEPSRGCPGGTDHPRRLAPLQGGRVQALLPRAAARVLGRARHDCRDPDGRRAPRARDRRHRDGAARRLPREPAARRSARAGPGRP